MMTREFINVHEKFCNIRSSINRELYERGAAGMYPRCPPDNQPGQDWVDDSCIHSIERSACPNNRVLNTCASPLVASLLSERASDRLPIAEFSRA